MRINKEKVKGKYFAYDGCHKIYIIEDTGDKNEAKKYGYKIYDIEAIEETYDSSCELRFISNWKLNKRYVNQFDEAIFE